MLLFDFNLNNLMFWTIVGAIIFITSIEIADIIFWNSD